MYKLIERLDEVISNLEIFKMILENKKGYGYKNVSDVVEVYDDEPSNLEEIFNDLKRNYANQPLKEK